MSTPTDKTDVLDQAWLANQLARVKAVVRPAVRADMDREHWRVNLDAINRVMLRAKVAWVKSLFAKQSDALDEVTPRNVVEAERLLLEAFEELEKPK